jgi:hypothetical protein
MKITEFYKSQGCDLGFLPNVQWLSIGFSPEYGGLLQSFSALDGKLEYLPEVSISNLYLITWTF